MLESNVYLRQDVDTTLSKSQNSRKLHVRLRLRIRLDLRPFVKLGSDVYPHQDVMIRRLVKRKIHVSYIYV